MNHTCHAYGCNQRINPTLLMCLKHWRMVPKFAQNDVWATYRPGQEVRKDPSNDYMKAQQRARVLCYMIENKMDITNREQVLSAAETVLVELKK